MQKMIPKELAAIVGLALWAMPVAAQSGADAPYLHADPAAVHRWQALRFGMFIHWGPISQKGTEISWSRQGPRRGHRGGGTGTIPVAVYDNLYKTFNPVDFNADQWVRIAKDAGMKYMVFTAKHHDGFSMFNSALTDYDIMSTPFHRDVVKELSQACREQGLRFGVYYSPRDWHHPDFATAHHDRYLKFYMGQLRELATHYGPLLVLWFDGLDSPRALWKDTPQRSFAMLRRLQPEILLNNRGGLPGDFDTPEQRIGAFNRRRPWETCMTIGTQWSWKPNDKIKSLKQCLQTLIRVAGGDGNLLFNVGPRPDGRIEPAQVDRLKEMGDWLGKYGDGIYGTRGGPFKPGDWGASTCRGNAIYLYVMDWPKDAALQLPVIGMKVERAATLSGGKAAVRQSEGGIAVTLPEGDRDPIATVIKLTVDGDAFTIDPKDVNLYGTPWGVKSATASNTYQKLAAYGPEKAADGNSSTRWATDVGTHAAWIAFDLGRPRTVGAAHIKEAYAGRVRAFELQYAEDGGWTTFYRGTVLGEDALLHFRPVTARRLRLKITEATQGPTIYEVQWLAGAPTP